MHVDSAQFWVLFAYKVHALGKAVRWWGSSFQYDVSLEKFITCCAWDVFAAVVRGVRVGRDYYTDGRPALPNAMCRRWCHSDLSRDPQRKNAIPSLFQ